MTHSRSAQNSTRLSFLHPTTELTVDCTMAHYPYSTPGTTYPYPYHSQTPGTYAPHPQQSGAYPTTSYQPYAPPTAVTSYGAAWSYHGYSYYPQQHQQQQAQPIAPKPATTTSITPAQTSTSSTPVTATPIAPSVAPRPPVPSTYTFTSYNRDPTLYGRSTRKGSNYRGLFTKERTYLTHCLWTPFRPHSRCSAEPDVWVRR